MVNDLAGKLIADKYRVDTLIREDDGGDLYAGTHEVLERPVTLKILPAAVAVDQRWVKRFVAEARAASALSHPNALNLTDFGTDAKSVTYAVFEPTAGTTLRDEIADGRPMDQTRALDIVRQVAAAVSAAHAKNITHGRLTPNNIFVEGDTAKVFGFGTDALESPRGADARYLAPEQSNAFPSSDARSDVYSLGVIFYEMLSGSVPFAGFTTAEVTARQNSEPPAPLSSFRDDLHPEIEPILLSAMALDPERRYPTMAAFAEDLELLAARVGGAPVTAAAAAAGGETVKRRSPWQTAAFVFAGIAIFAVALIYATSVRKTDPTETMVAAADGSLPVQPIGSATGAQEESLAKMPPLTEAEIMAAANQMASDLPGGDGYNAWANGGIPPAGAPLAGSQPGMPMAGGMYPPPTNYIPQGGQVISVDGQSQFMPNDLNPGGVQLIRRDVNTGACTDMASGQPVPCPPGTPAVAAPKASPTPKTQAPAGNTATTTTEPQQQPTPAAGATPKPMATPPTRTRPTPNRTENPKPATNKPAESNDELTGN